MSTIVAVQGEHVRTFGDVFTRRWVAEVLLDLSGYAVDRDLTVLRLVEPAAGAGAFLLPAVMRLLESARAHDRATHDLGECIQAWEVQPQLASDLRERIVSVLEGQGVAPDDAHSLASRWVVVGDYLLGGNARSVLATDRADIVIGNPPYIRLEQIPDELANEYRRRWPAMGGRADAYIGFLERSLSILRPEGRVAFICADRWMRNQYGQTIRKIIATSYAVDHVWVMHDVDAFEQQVSAYPAITVIRNGQQSGVITADTTADFNEYSAAQLLKWSATPQESRFAGPGVSAHRLPHWFGGDESWPTGSPDRLRLIEKLNDEFYPLHDAVTGTKVSIGVATGADGVFVTTNPHCVEPDRLIPLAMVRDLRSGIFVWSGSYLVNPWAANGSLVDLDSYPRLRSYFGSHGTKLRGRFVAKKSPSAWYRTIDKVDHGLTGRAKLLLQDMKSTIHPVLEPGGHYPHHNVYYVVSDKWDLDVLGGLLLSRISQAFIEAYCVRMNGNTLRFQAQYLKKIRVPRPGSIGASTCALLAQAFRNRDVESATLAAADAYGIDLKEYDLV
ncbi:Eco57I restriction-modification methylase domain-containing protein [Micromonospora sp. NBC_01813]|uniref:Eco57I restriction-modification methylase domain-containing protein n=1 Tax=Micromonospora sp. NBC_01813 TaxID=2975988 RepID=UPI002DD984C0|nr:Eco57I restriction-modification methylase domain-containing protein [Micromonospora sp. NBC_01813]WSA09002.1 Eco57I restriction-modification methylase domain-containing protein [Micromonospora sp. NBC_01813]